MTAELENSITLAIREFKQLDSSLAANLIVEHFEGRAYALASTRFRNSKLRNDIGDIVNESFFKLFQQLKRNPSSIEDRDSLWSIFANILRQKTIDQIRYIYAESRGGHGRRSQDKALARYCLSKGLLSQETIDRLLQELTRADSQATCLQELLVDHQLVSAEELMKATIECSLFHAEKDRQSIVRVDQDGNEISFEQFMPTPQSNEAASELVQRVFDLVEQLEDPVLVQILHGKASGETNEQIGIRVGLSRESVRRKFELIKLMAAEKITRA